MPKAILEFDLPDDQGDFDAALAGRAALSALWGIDQHCRGLLKHGSPSPDQRSVLEEIRALIPPDLLEK